MRSGAVSISEIIDEGGRMTGGFHLSEDQRAVAIVKRSHLRKDTVSALTQSRGIYRGPIFARRYVDGPDHGEPYVSAKDLVMADVQPSAYLGRTHGDLLEFLRLREGMILVTCSGMNLGRAIWVRPDLDGLVGSHDLIRICPDASKVPPGYMFAFLASRYGHAQIRRQIYGGHIKHIEPQHIADLLVPRLAKDLERCAHELVEQAAALRADASATLARVTADVEAEIKAPAVKRLRDDSRMVGNAVSVNSIGESRRFDAFFHNPIAADLDGWISKHPNGFRRLGEVANVFDVPPFKHIYVEADRGIPFYTSGDLFRLERLAEKYLSRMRTKSLDKYIIEAGWILLARSGQLGGIIGRPQFADSALHGASTSDHVIRIIPDRALVPPGYLYAYLSTPSVGYSLLTRTMTGASVPALWPKYLNEVCVVGADVAFMEEIDNRVQCAFENRVRATAYEREARVLVERAIEEVT